MKTDNIGKESPGVGIYETKLYKSIESNAKRGSSFGLEKRNITLEEMRKTLEFREGIGKKLERESSISPTRQDLKPELS